MIVQLPKPLRGTTHLLLYERLDSGDSLRIAFRLGNLDADGNFVPDALLGDPRIRLIAGDEYTALLDAAAAGGAPRGEYRRADVKKLLDVKGWIR